MKKKHFFIAIAFWLVGVIYGAIFNFILRGDNASVLFSYVQGLFVGFLSGALYYFLTFAFGVCFTQEFFDDDKIIIKTSTVLSNVVAFVGMCYAITMLIGNFKPITLPYAWMHIVNLLFVGAVVGKANYDGKVLRKQVNLSTKREEQ